MSDERARVPDSLLTQVMTNTLDEDYATVAARGRPAAQPRRKAAGLAVVLVLAAFGVLVGVSALITEQDRPRAAAERAELIDEIRVRQNRLDGLHVEIALLGTEIARLQQRIADEAISSAELNDRVRTLSMEAGTLAVTGPGVVITVDDAPSSGSGTGGVILDRDLHALVNGLWVAGAEAMSIDGHRLTTLTAIRFAGRAITVDYRSITPPYVIEVVGDPDTLPARLLETPAGQMWLSLESNFAIRFDTVTKDQVTVPADPHEHLLYATPKGDR